MRKTQFFWYLLTVFGVGVLFGLLYAPRKGIESRKVLIDKMQDCYKQSCDFITTKAKELKEDLEKNS